ncbi:phosphotransferase [Bacillus sp. CGMCC 1.16541]|uniref:phosphotransferase n=1 Tax=Bacillus sp. CGMCC 1.16541 TaxID=2185143 RepID=UPI0013A52E3B|nr:phosphotransferase [Bacillus sp. CGMCC 1.16541]
MHNKQQLITEALTFFFPFQSPKVWKSESGANNTTRFIELNGVGYVLRIYESHRDYAKIQFEHDVLLRLKALLLPFKTPEPYKTITDESIVVLSNGQLAALFYFADGQNPQKNENYYYSYGVVTAQLTKALRLLDVSRQPVYQPYYNLDQTHPSCSLEDVLCFCADPSDIFTNEASDLTKIQRSIQSFQDVVSTLKSLPHQLIHGDLNASNILINKDAFVTAVLDFEFVTYDLRVMEVAVCLSEFIHPASDIDTIMNKTTAFLSGYGSILTLTKAEIDVLPLLISLRRLDVFIHFLGRYLDGINDEETVKKQINKAVEMIDWLAKYEKVLSNTLLCLLPK